MTELEYGIRKLSDVRLRRWLRDSTGTALGSIGTGVITTAILQSSSMVSLLVLAFASAGLLPFVNAVGIILGANLGTTVTGWIVALFGFKLNLEAMALPFLGVSAFFYTFGRRDSRIRHGSLIVLGLGMLLLGLSIMKSSMETLPERLDVAILQGHAAFLYLLFGAFVTLLVQSSSAVMMMSLAALNSGIIALPEAAAVVIGADLGTTGTTVLGSITGNMIKRQLALAHCIFNLIVDLAAFFLLLPLLPWLLALLGVNDPLFGLVAFHSAMNLLGLMAFLPILAPFSTWVEAIFARAVTEPKTILEKVAPEVVEAAIVAMQDSVRLLVIQALLNALRGFSLHPERFKVLSESFADQAELLEPMDFSQGYEALKRQEGAILRYALNVQAQPLEPEEVVEVERIQRIARAVVYCNKTLKDIAQDLRELRNATEPALMALYVLQKEFNKDVYVQLIDLLVGDHASEFILEELEALNDLNDRHFKHANNSVHLEAGMKTDDGTVLSLALNVNGEIRLALRNMLKSIRILIIDQTNVQQI